MNCLKLGALVLLTALIACSSKPDETPTSQTQKAVVGTSEPMIAGFQLRVENSKFLLTKPAPESTNGVQKLVGLEGVFATFDNGMVLSIPNGDAPSRLRPALTASGDEHNARVLSYFHDCGLPSEQVDSVSAHATMHQALDPTEGGPDHSQKPIFDWYSSVVTRQIRGIRVADSFAWARFNIDDQVVSEGVYWPDVPESIATQAAAFKMAAASSAFVAKLPGGVSEVKGEVVIHHTTGEARRARVFTVTYDVTRPIADGMSRAMHFDERGAEVTFPEEQSTDAGQMKNP